MTSKSNQISDSANDKASTGSKKGDTSNGKKWVADKVQELNRHLLKDDGAKGKKGKADDSSIMPSSLLATTLFGKAPADFLEQKSLTELGEITNRALHQLESYLSGEQKILVEIDNKESVSGFYITLGDRPFIVNSVTECVHGFGFDLSALLHPVIIHQGQRISLSYFELRGLTKDQEESLKSRLLSALQDLGLITEDFSAMLVRADTLARLFENQSYSTAFPQAERREITEFLRWLVDGGFIFLGHAEWRIAANRELPTAPSTTLGLFKSKNSFQPELLAEVKQDALRLLETNEPILISKLNLQTPVHHRRRMTSVVIQELSSDGKVIAVHVLLGLLTSKALAEESSSAPLIRRKLQQLLEREEALPHSHDYKNIVKVLDNMPMEDALAMDIEDLRHLVTTVIHSHGRNQARVGLYPDGAGRGILTLVILPRDRFNNQTRVRVQEYLEEQFAAPAQSSEYRLDVSLEALARFYFYVPVAGARLPKVEISKLESDIETLSRTWEDRLRALMSDNSDKKGQLWSKYQHAFGEDYQALQSVEECVQDISYLEKLSEAQPLSLALGSLPEPQRGLFDLNMYSLGQEVTISRAVPVLERAGLEVISERACRVTPRASQDCFVHQFKLRPRSTLTLNHKFFDEIVGPGLVQVLTGQAQNDPLNSLLLNPGLDMRAVSLLRAYSSFFWQVNKFATRLVINSAIAQRPSSARALWDMFALKFSPKSKLNLSERKTEFEKARNGFLDSLRDVSDITQDRILRGLCLLLEHTVRTNFYLNRPAIALKIHSEKVEILPSPRPLYEIFVSSPLVEGVHLRGGMVARGGIRWSDRKEDYRTEVLGLMKTQKIKNALIVPGGAKGGFIVHSMPEDPGLQKAAVEQAYAEFIRSLLSVSDNLVQGKVKHPSDVVLWDGEDPYLVVAADKGTATFSDIANRIATQEYEFWLGDAFASGGSKGYDHKIYGITAKGAWECTIRHFMELGIDYLGTPFTVTGIGDLAGDVFGNGLILSDKMKLIAAFNHKHIFVDPDPDPAISFSERKRLFEAKGSQWSDYRKEAMSVGSGIYGRFDKEVRLSNEARKALGIDEDAPQVMSGEQVINCILKAPATLLWNGGIGTYVKGRSESHADVNDGTNDRVRVNADDLRVKIIAEGGNLGLTQQARIEFAQNGGSINTDAIDNSGGVDLSDHEVNIKILFAQLMKDGEVTRDERDTLMREAAGDVVEHVLGHNRTHALALSMGVVRSRKNIGYFQSLIRDLVRMGHVNRQLECLPDDDELNERARNHDGLTRSELAVCLAAVKMWTKSVLLGSNLLQDPILKAYLLEYFPPSLQERFKKAILSHPLAPNIIATQVTNTLIDNMEPTFVHRMCSNHGATPITVIKCAIAAEIILDAKQVRQSLHRLDTFSGRETFFNALQDVTRTMRAATSWLISYHGDNASIAEMVELYRKAYLTLLTQADGVFTGEERKGYDKAVVHYTGLGISELEARSLSVFPKIISVFEVLWTSRQSGKNVALVAGVFSRVLQQLKITRILELEQKIEINNKWENELRVNSFQEIRRSVSKLTGTMLERNLTEKEAISHTLVSSPSWESFQGTMHEIGESVPQVATLSVVAKQLRMFQL